MAKSSVRGTDVYGGERPPLVQVRSSVMPEFLSKEVVTVAGFKVTVGLIILAVVIALVLGNGFLKKG